MRRDTRSQATNTGLMSLLLMLANQIRRMDEKPPVTIALVAGLAHVTSIAVMHCLEKGPYFCRSYYSH